MPPRNRRRRVEEDVSSAPPPAAAHQALPALDRFVNESARSRYLTNLLSRSFIRERGFDLPRMQRHRRSVWNIIVHQRWQRYCAQPEPAVTPLVREFYANASAAEARTVMIRGRNVNYDARAINAFIGAEHVDYQEYAAHLTADFREMPDDLLSTLCEEGAHWGGVQRMNNQVIEQKYLKPEVKMWYMFICARLSPTSHVGQVTRVRAFILWYLMTRRRLNAGLIISDEILSCSRSNQGLLCFPSLITALCQAAGVHIGPNEETLPPRAVILSPPVSRNPSVRSPTTEARRRPPQDGGESSRRGSGNQEVMERLERIGARQRRLANYTTEAVDALGARLTWMHVQQGHSIAGMPSLPPRLLLSDSASEGEEWDDDDDDDEDGDE